MERLNTISSPKELLIRSVRNSNQNEEPSEIAEVTLKLITTTIKELAKDKDIEQSICIGFVILMIVTVFASLGCNSFCFGCVNIVGANHNLNSISFALQESIKKEILVLLQQKTKHECEVDGKECKSLKKAFEHFENAISIIEITDPNEGNTKYIYKNNKYEEIIKESAHYILIENVENENFF